MLFFKTVKLLKREIFIYTLKKLRIYEPFWKRTKSYVLKLLLVRYYKNSERAWMRYMKMSSWKWYVTRPRSGSVTYHLRDDIFIYLIHASSLFFISPQGKNEKVTFSYKIKTFSVFNIAKSFVWHFIWEKYRKLHEEHRWEKQKTHISTIK